MYTKQFIYYIYIFNILIIYSYGLNDTIIYTYENITTYNRDEYFFKGYDKNHTLSRNEVLKIKNSINLSYYCKNNICVEVDRDLMPEFIEFPDEKGNIKLYISNSYTYNDLKLNEYLKGICHSYDNKNKICRVAISFTCTSDLQCLTNKCFNNICIFNEENPIDFCADIYSYFLFYGAHTYMHCGKAIGEMCKTDEECGSNRCLKNGECSSPIGPSESDGAIEIFILLLTFNIIFILCCCCCIKNLIIKIKKYKKINNYS